MIRTTPAIEAVGLSQILDGQTVLRNVSLSMEESACIVLTGANGAGKTTLLRCLAGALRPDAGEVRWYGRRVGSDPRARKVIGFLPHESRLYRQLTLRENLIFAGRMSGLTRPAERADQLLASTGLTRYADRLPSLISRGLRQRLAIVRAIAHRPRIVLLDEPFSGLDAAGSSWLRDLIKNLCAYGNTACIATHRPELSCEFASRTYSLELGELQEVKVETRASEKWRRVPAAR